MKNIKNLKYYVTTFLLSGIISLSGCSNDKDSSMDELSRALEGEPISIELLKDNTEETKEEEKVEKIYTLDNLYLTYTNGIVKYTDIYEDDSVCIPFSKLVDYYNYPFEYEIDINSITEKQANKVVVELNKKLGYIPNNLVDENNYISMDKLCFIEESNVEDGKIVLNTIFYDGTLTSTKNTESELKSLKERYNDSIIELNKKYYISKLDYLLINGNKSLEIDIKDILKQEINSNSINDYSNYVLKDIGLKLNKEKISNEKLIFDPNDKLIINNLFVNTSKEDLEDVAKEYIALNKDYLDDKTIYMVVESYINSYSVFTLDEIKEQCINGFIPNERQLSYTANSGLKDGLEKTINYLKSDNKKRENIKTDGSIKSLSRLVDLIVLMRNSKDFYEIDNSSVESKIKLSILNEYCKVEEDYYYELKSKINIEPSNLIESNNDVNLKRLVKYLLINYNDEYNIEFNKIRTDYSKEKDYVKRNNL